MIRFGSGGRIVDAAAEADGREPRCSRARDVAPLEIPDVDGVRRRGAERGDGARDALLALAAAGVKIGVVSDVGYTPGRVIARFLDAAGLAELCEPEAMLFSDEFGAYKREPAMFRRALAVLGAAPANAVHVGDLKRSDVAGARAAGLVTVRFRGCVDDPSAGPEADHVIADLRELPTVLGLGTG